MQIIGKRQSKIIAVILAVAMALSCFTLLPQSANAATGDKQAYKEGDDISDKVFYIAVDGDGDGSFQGEADGIYYYSYDEIKDAGDTVRYEFVNHGETEYVSVKGAKLSNLIEDLSIEVEQDWIIQYMEEDAYHATAANYQDTVQGLTDPDGVGNGSGVPYPAETIIGYAAKTTYENPNDDRVNEKVYSAFLGYAREASYVRAYRQTDSANSSTLKLLKGAVISNDANKDNLPNGEVGYQLYSVNAEGEKIADDYEVMGFVEGMKWAAAYNVDVPWAVCAESPKTVTIGSDVSQEVSFTFTEQPFFEAVKGGEVVSKVRSDLAKEGGEYPTTNVNPADGVEYEYFGFDKPMYIRYYGVSLESALGDTVDSDDKVYIVTKKGEKIKVDNIEDYFVAYYKTESKSATNISNGKRTPLDYAYSVIVDTSSADIYYSNDGSDYSEAGIAPVTYENGFIYVNPTTLKAPTLKAQLSGKKAKLTFKNLKNEDGYQIQRKTGKDGNWGTVATVKKNKTTWTSKYNLSKGKTYYYRVRAYEKVNGEKVYANWSSVKKVKR